MRKVRVWLAVGAVVALLLWLLTESLLVNLQAGRSVALFSVYRYDPLGMAAFRQYLQRSGINVRLLKHPAMNVKWKGVLIDVQPPRSGGHLLLSATLSKHYHPRLMRWVQRGNTLFEVTYHNTHITRHEGLIVAPLARHHKKRQSPRQVPRDGQGISRYNARKKPTSAPSPPSTTNHRKADSNGKSREPSRKKTSHRHFASIRSAPEPRLRIVDEFYFAHRNPKWYNALLIPARWQTLHPHQAEGFKTRARPPVWLAMPSRFRGWKSGRKPVWHPLLMYQHQALALERRYGKGHILLLGSPWPLLNGGIDSGSNLKFLMHIIGRKPVIFNEWGLGVGGQLTTLELFSQFGLDALAIQLLVLLAAILWGSRRFSHRQQPSNQTVVASNVEQIAMLGRLYQHTMSDADFCARVAAEVQRRLAACMKVPPDNVAMAVNRLRSDLQRRTAELLSNIELLVKTTSGTNPPRRGQKLHCASLLTQSAILCEEIKRDRKSPS